MSLSPGEYVFLKYCTMPSNTLLNQTREDMFSGIGFILNVTRLSQNLKRLFSVGLFSTTSNRCLLILWRFRTYFVANLLLQESQAYGFMFSCITILCRFRLDFVESFLGQISQGYGLCFSCTVSM